VRGSHQEALTAWVLASPGAGQPGAMCYIDRRILHQRMFEQIGRLRRNTGPSDLKNFDRLCRLAFLAFDRKPTQSLQLMDETVRHVTSIRSHSVQR
jgi:hypothetical protein